MFRRTATALIGMTLLSLPTATHAESRVRHDARHDVVAPSGHARPANASSDLTRVAVHHRARVVSVTAQVRDLAARPRTTILVTHIVTPDRTYTVNVTRWEAQSARIFLVSSEDVPLKCRGARAAWTPSATSFVSPSLAAAWGARRGCASASACSASAAPRGCRTTR